MVIRVLCNQKCVSQAIIQPLALAEEGAELAPVEEEELAGSGSERQALEAVQLEVVELLERATLVALF